VVLRDQRYRVSTETMHPAASVAEQRRCGATGGIARPHCIDIAVRSLSTFAELQGAKARAILAETSLADTRNALEQVQQKNADLEEEM
jgi:hypothetical protein